LNPEPTSLLQGTLDLLILKSLATGEMHGLGISRRIQQITQGTFVVKPGFPRFGETQKTIAARNTTA